MGCEAEGQGLWPQVSVALRCESQRRRYDSYPDGGWCKPCCEELCRTDAQGFRQEGGQEGFPQLRNDSAGRLLGQAWTPEAKSFGSLVYSPSSFMLSAS